MDHVYLWDNGSADRARLEVALRQQFAGDYLTLAFDAQPRAQMKIYGTCMELYREQYNWLALIDVDEYIVLRSQYAPSTWPMNQMFY